MGGNGTLGRALVRSLKQTNWKVLSVDYSENAEACSNLLLTKDEKI